MFWTGLKMNIFSDPFIQFDTENLVEWGFEKKRILNLGRLFELQRMDYFRLVLKWIFFLFFFSLMEPFVQFYLGLANVFWKWVKYPNRLDWIISGQFLTGIHFCWKPIYPMKKKRVFRKTERNRVWRLSLWHEYLIRIRIGSIFNQRNLI